MYCAFAESVFKTGRYMKSFSVELPLFWSTNVSTAATDSEGSNLSLVDEFFDIEDSFHAQ